MRVSLEWLKEYVDIGADVEDLTERLDLTGTAVEAVERMGAVFDGVVVGRVVSREPHPDADKLSYCTVDVGDEELPIVCGADNFGEGDKVPVALVGAHLPNGMVIEKAKIRGCVSHGMMCSPIELGLGEDASGLMILDEEAPSAPLSPSTMASKTSSSISRSPRTAPTACPSQGSRGR
jgi:phenylalanyl-tRNA synthetase beta chain